MQFRACFLNREMPSDRRLGRIAFSLQSGDFLDQGGLVSDPPCQALALKYTELQFGHVQPTALLGRVMKLQPFEKASRLCGREGLIQRGGPMGVEIIQHHSDQLGFGLRLKPRGLRRAKFGQTDIEQSVRYSPSGVSDSNRVRSARTVIRKSPGRCTVISEAGGW